jgi:hypothetical protein
MDDQALQQLRRAIERGGSAHATIQWTMSGSGQTLSHPGIKGRWHRAQVSIRRVAPSRYQIEAAVAHAILTQATDDQASIRLVHVPVLPADIRERLDALLAARMGADPAIAVVSDGGGAYLRLAPWNVATDWPDDASDAALMPASSAPWSYTDASQWVLKLLLLGPLRQNLWWQAPDHWDGMLRSGPEIARVSGITVPSAYDMLERLRQTGWIAHRRGLPIRLTRPEHILADWLLVARRARPGRLPIKPLFPRGADDADQIAWLARLASRLPATTPWALTSWAACQLHHVDISTDASAYPVTIAAAGDQVEILSRLECSACEPGDAVAYLDLRPGKHAFRGVVRHGGVPVVDLVQAALDVASDPARGLEQAEHLVEIIVEAYRKAWPGQP